MRSIEDWKLCYAVMHDVMYEITKSIELGEISYRKDLDNSMVRLAKMCDSVDTEEHMEIRDLVRTKRKETYNERL